MDVTHLAGQNVLILAVEPLHSPHDCRACFQELAAHTWQPWGNPLGPPTCHRNGLTPYAAIGTESPVTLGLSLACWWDYQTDRWYWSDADTASEVVYEWILRQPLMITYGGQGFDLPILGALACEEYRESFETLAARSYDIGVELWRVSPPQTGGEPTAVRESLPHVAQANGMGHMLPPQVSPAARWRASAYRRSAEVIAQVMGRVVVSKRLFEKILTYGYIVDSDSAICRLPTPWDAREK